MTTFPTAFTEALDLAMKFEVGPHYDSNDIEVQQGLCETRDQQRKTGYVDHPSDPGGETKFGIAKNFNTTVDIKELTLDEAREIYFDRYWKLSNCTRLPPILAAVYFDAVVNHGTKRAVKILQKVVGTKDDGAFGPMTLAATESFVQRNGERAACEDYITEREDFYHRLVAYKSSYGVFLKGWLNRIDGLQTWLNSQNI